MLQISKKLGSIVASATAVSSLVVSRASAQTGAGSFTNGGSSLGANNLGNLQLSIFTPANANTGLLTGIAGIVQFALLIAGLLAFCYALYGGFSYLTAGGKDDGATAGRKIIINAVIGLIIIFMSYAIVSFVISRINTSV